MTGPHERFSGGLNKTQLLKSNIQKKGFENEFNWSIRCRHMGNGISQNAFK